MAIDLKLLDKSGIKGWGATIAMSLQLEAARISKLSDRELNEADLTALKSALNSFEEIRARANELSLNVYGNSK